MATLSPSDLLEQLNWRYATKQFDPNQPVADEVWQALEDSLVLTPSSYGLQPWKFIVVTDPAVKAQLKPLSWNQDQITDCSHLVVFTIKKNLSAADVDRLMESTATTREVPVESLAGYRNMIVSDVVQGPRSLNVNDWATSQAYIALGNFMTSAAVLGVDTCPLEGIEPAGYDKVLNLLGSGFATVVACAAGHRSAADKYAELAKVRYPHDEMVEVV
ncbi:MAG: Nitroreductase [Phormidesmis priestleyi Ana]|uniref:Nitroreductase n=1 Tax=Phormidesmis priestleyi Ana TaxID=1666911 RepID=A0A0N8KMM7_9CYAN|nr:MAG: Nitroreductase [Phormidesmis priestleyi Ana]